VISFHRSSESSRRIYNFHNFTKPLPSRRLDEPRSPPDRFDPRR
jgi:hypothetical protein